MIYIDRSSIATPSVFTSEKLARQKKKLNQFFTEFKRNKQARFNFSNVHTNLEVKEVLLKLFHNKCAYCESLLEAVSYTTVDHFRPKGGAMNLDGTVHDDHYWWLAYEWENLYSSCNMCNSRKHTRFPVQGKRITQNEPVSIEKPWILDPCNKDDFNTPHFTLDENGFMTGLSRKGEITIDIFSLNRAPLLQARENIAKQMKVIVENLTRSSDKKVISTSVKDNIQKLVAPSSPYSAAALFYYNFYSEKKSISKHTDFYKNFLTNTENISPITKSMYSSEKLDADKPSPIPMSNMSYSMGLESDQEKEAYFMSAKRIQKIEIVNFKIIKKLVLEFPKSKEKIEPWMVLLGENGAGKSSVLQAIALTLAGEKRANELGLNASRFVNRNTTEKTGYVRVYLEGLKNYLELKFNKDSEHFTSNYDAPKVILLAFGSTRLMSNTEDHDTNNNLTNLRNLFDPFATLPNVEEWVGDPSIVSVNQFDQIAIALKNVLQLPDNKLIYRRKTRAGRYELFIKLNEEKQGIKVRELSAGYQAVITMTLNIIKEILNIWESFHIAEGIVLIDEIGVHLHPKWKLQIISTLREIFPMMNFIITTHEPLCLRGINEGEIALMKMDENNQVIALMDLPSPKGLTIEQLITSKFFGLITSFDPEVEAQLNSFYLLKSKLKPTETEISKLEKLRTNLEKINIIDSEANLGATKKKEISLENTSLDAGWVNNPLHQDDLKKRIKAIWDKKSI